MQLWENRGHKDKSPTGIKQQIKCYPKLTECKRFQAKGSECSGLVRFSNWFCQSKAYSKGLTWCRCVSNAFQHQSYTRGRITFCFFFTLSAKDCFPAVLSGAVVIFGYCFASLYKLSSQVCLDLACPRSSRRFYHSLRMEESLEFKRCVFLTRFMRKCVWAWANLDLVKFPSFCFKHC